MKPTHKVVYSPAGSGKYYEVMAREVQDIPKGLSMRIQDDTGRWNQYTLYHPHIVSQEEL